jgi:hypothetical protein
MTTGRLPSRRISGFVPVLGAVLVTSMVAGHPAVAEVIGGSAILLVAVVLGTNLAGRAVAERDPSRHLILDLLLAAVVLLALAGAAVIGLAIPIPA